jgi:hypothetical protein
MIPLSLIWFGGKNGVRFAWIVRNSKTRRVPRQTEEDALASGGFRFLILGSSCKVTRIDPDT